MHALTNTGREPEEIFDEELAEICSKGLHIYQRQFLRCSLQMGDGTRCGNFAYNHDRHQSEKGLIWVGSMDRSTFEKEGADVVSSIKKAFISFYSELWDVTAQFGAPTLDATSAYRRRILGRERASVVAPLVRVGTLRAEDFVKPDQMWSTLQSNMTCFACLQYAPDHVLPCGHGFCEECIKDFGKLCPQRSYHYQLDECVLCDGTALNWRTQTTDNLLLHESLADGSSTNECRRAVPQIIRLNPRCGGIRILTLDGGGIRGIIEIALIEKIEQRTGLNLPISEFFDLVVGTSTGMWPWTKFEFELMTAGGIIALALTSSTEANRASNLSSKFINLARKVFEKDRFGLLWKMDPTISNIMMFLRVMKSRYKSGKLKTSLLDFFDKDQPVFGGAVTTLKQRTARVAVTSTSDGYPCLFTNYSRAAYAREDLSDLDHLIDNKGFERQDNPGKEAKVWEALVYFLCECTNMLLTVPQRYGYFSCTGIFS